MGCLMCTYKLSWPGEPPEDGEMNEMTLPSKHSFFKFKPWRSEAKNATSRKPERQSRFRTCDLRLSGHAVLTTAPDRPAEIRGFVKSKKFQKSVKNSEVGGWVCFGPSRNFFWKFFWVFLFFFVVHVFKKKNF